MDRNTCNVVNSGITDVCNVRKKYGYFLKDHKRLFGEIGEIDLVDEINSHLAECDYSVIMQMLNPSLSDFDFDSLDVSDFSGLDPVDLYSQLDNVKASFDTLPLEVKKHYGNSSEKFVADIVGGGFADYVASIRQSEQDVESVKQPVTAGDRTVSQQSSGESEVDSLRRELVEVRELLNRNGAKASSEGGSEE